MMGYMFVVQLAVVCLMLSSPTEARRSTGQGIRLFRVLDGDNDRALTRAELTDFFMGMDLDGNRAISSWEFGKKWRDDRLGSPSQAADLYNFINVNSDRYIDDKTDLTFVFKYFNTDRNDNISMSEFLEGWRNIPE